MNSFFTIFPFWNSKVYISPGRSIPELQKPKHLQKQYTFISVSDTEILNAKKKLRPTVMNTTQKMSSKNETLRELDCVFDIGVNNYFQNLKESRMKKDSMKKENVDCVSEEKEVIKDYLLDSMNNEKQENEKHENEKQENIDCVSEEKEVIKDYLLDSMNNEK